MQYAWIFKYIYLSIPLKLLLFITSSFCSGLHQFGRLTKIKKTHTTKNIKLVKEHLAWKVCSGRCILSAYEFVINQMTRFYPSRDEDGAIIRPLPTVKRVLR